jgi:microcin C transport system substrate-binding protein
VWFPEDHSLVSYRLRPNARWHDGNRSAPMTFFIHSTFKKEQSIYGAYYRHVVKVEDRRTRITFTFDGPGNRELPQIVDNCRCCRNTGGKAPTNPAANEM